MPYISSWTMETWFPVCSLYRQERHFEEEKTWASFQAHKLECFQSLPQLSEKYMFGITESSLFKNMHLAFRSGLVEASCCSDHQFCHVFYFCYLPAARKSVLWHLINRHTDFQLSLQHHFRYSTSVMIRGTPFVCSLLGIYLLLFAFAPWMHL